MTWIIIRLKKTGSEEKAGRGRSGGENGEEEGK